MPKIPSRHCPIGQSGVDQSRFLHFEPCHNNGLPSRLSFWFKIIYFFLTIFCHELFMNFLMVSIINFHERSLSLKMTPPHVQLLLIIRWTIHGHEFETASTPPIILLLPSCPESSGGPLGARHFSPSGILFSAAGLVASVVVFLVVVTFWVVVLVGSKFPQCHFEKS